jgi:2-(1,2-epoxy-1,2-dihydrophenyl)acetyl-CoA isomerase
MSMVEYRASGGVGVLTLNRPERMNTMTAEFLEDALAAFELAAGDEDTRVVILTGAGRAFCAGGDLAAGPGGAVGGDGPLPAQTGRLRRFMRSSQLLREMPKITIAAVNGACAGAGLSWACAADLRYAATGARFATAFVNAGLSGDFGGTWLLPRLVGAAKARELYLLSEPFDAAEAHRLGLVVEVVDPDHLLERVHEVATRLAARAPIALRLIKENLREHEERDFAAALDGEARRHAFCATTFDAAEAAEAFVGKRAPEFRGR